MNTDQVNEDKELSGVTAESPRPAQESDICGEPRFAGGWGSICYQPKAHRPPHIFECGGGDDDV